MANSSVQPARVDIIIPVYNVGAFLSRCLDSVLSQTFTGWRAICVDDGSTDDCPQILDSYAAADSRFTVIHKRNGGLSDARNAGMAAAGAEFIMFIDSDDFIHPQTLELALAFADRDGSDLVSWYRDSQYRNIQVKLLRRLGRDDIHATPWRMSRRYDINKVRSLVTEDIIGNSTDSMHTSSPMTIKHCWVWRHLFRREAIAGVKFLTGVNYEDIPWWSEVMLHLKRATITRLPLYYYYPNRKSISKTTDQNRRNILGLKGLNHAFNVYRSQASEMQMSDWSHNIKWPILCRMFDDCEMEMTAEFKEMVRDLWDEGFFKDAVHSDELIIKHRVLHFCQHEALRLSRKSSRLTARMRVAR